MQLQQYLPFTVLKLSDRIASIGADGRLQQYLPFTVLKPIAMMITITVAANCFVATVPTVYGIETLRLIAPLFLASEVATVPTVYGIETYLYSVLTHDASSVATVPTVYGIETLAIKESS